MATKRKTTEKDSDIVIKFESVTDFERYFETHDTAPTWEGPTRSNEESENRTKFTTTANFKDAQDLLKYGDRANFEKLQAAGLKDTNTAQIGMKKQRQLYTAVTGHAAHVPNYIAGIPTAMIAQRQVKVRQRVVNIVYNNSYGCDIKADEVIEASVDLLNYISKIESAGVRVNLYVASISCMKSGGAAQGFILKIKDSGQYIDLLKTAYPLINPSFLRRHDFRFLEITPGVPYNSNYGYVIMDEEKTKRIIGEAGIEGGILIEAQRLINATRRQEFLNRIFNPEN